MKLDSNNAEEIKKIIDEITDICNLKLEIDGCVITDDYFKYDPATNGLIRIVDMIYNSTLITEIHLVNKAQLNLKNTKNYYIYNVEEVLAQL